MVPPCSDRVSRAPPYSRIIRTLRIRGYHPLRPAFPCRSASFRITTGLIRVRSPLLAESLLMSFPPGTEMFQFPGFASCTYVFSAGYPIGVGCPIRTLRDQSLLAAPPEFSQRATSFIASWCQGIHRMPFSCSNIPRPTLHRNNQHGRPAKTDNEVLLSNSHAPDRCNTHIARSSQLTPARCRVRQPTMHRHGPLTPHPLSKGGETRGVLRAQERTRT